MIPDRKITLRVRTCRRGLRGPPSRDPEHRRHVSLREASLQAPRPQPLSQRPRGLRGPGLRGYEALSIQWQHGQQPRRFRGGVVGVSARGGV